MSHHKKLKSKSIKFAKITFFIFFFCGEMNSGWVNGKEIQQGRGGDYQGWGNIETAGNELATNYGSIPIIGYKLFWGINLHKFCIISNYFSQIHHFWSTSFLSEFVDTLHIPLTNLWDKRNKKKIEGLWDIRIKGLWGFFGY